MKMWDVEYGSVVVDIEDKSPIRTVGWSYSGEKFFYSTDKAMGQKCALKVFTLGAAKAGGGETEPCLTIPCHESKVTSAIWGPLDETIITGHENGDLIKWDSTSGEELRRVKHFRSNINDLQYNADCSMFISASKDTTCKVFDVDELEVLKEWKTERPVNSAAFSPIRDHVVMGGGQDAMSVTTTSTKVGKFDAAFYHLIYEEELGRVKGHFGPINTLAFNPSGKQYASGGEDGYIRIHDFDPSYFQFEFEVGAH